MKIWFKGFAALMVAAILLIAAFAVYGHGDNKHTSPTPTPRAEAEASPESTIEAPPELTANAAADASEFPNYHPLVVHFPIVLLIFAAVFQILSFFVYRKEMSAASMLMLAAGVASVWLASNTFHGHAGELPEKIRQIFEEHERMADYTLWFSAAALPVKLVSHFVTGRKWWSETATFLLLAGAAVTVSIAGHHGAQLVHIEGVGPKGNYLEQHNH